MAKQTQEQTKARVISEFLDFKINDIVNFDDYPAYVASLDATQEAVTYAESLK
jgi:hypothetical protein